MANWQTLRGRSGAKWYQSRSADLAQVSGRMPTPINTADTFLLAGPRVPIQNPSRVTDN
jgi:hypothetical protein